MNGKKVPDEQIEQLLELAHWAPTHGRTEPWQFFVFSGEALQGFGKDHGALYTTHTDPEKQNPETPAKLSAATEKVSHLVVAAMKRGSNPKIPQVEEVAAVSAAVQNVLLGAEALGLAAIWNTGGMSHNPAMKQMLGLGDEDIVLGLIYIGYTDEVKREGKRHAAASEKAMWMR